MYKTENGRKETPQERQGLVAQLLELLEPQADSTLLDVGCGAGELTRDLAPHFAAVTGVDLSEAMLERARAATEGVELQVAPADELPFADASFSRALCYSVFQDFPDFAYARRACREILRTLTPGGIAVLADIPDLARRHLSIEERRWRQRSVFTRAWHWSRRLVSDAFLGPRPYGFYPMSFFLSLAAADGHQVRIVPQTAALWRSAWRNHVVIQKRK